MKIEIANLDFVDLKNRNDMKKIREWVKSGYLYEIYLNSIGEEFEFKTKLNKKQIQQVEKHYNLDAFNILARSQKLILQELQDIKGKLGGDNG